MKKYYKIISCYLIFSLSIFSINGCGLLYNMQTGVKITDATLKLHDAGLNTTGRTKIFYGDYFTLYRTDEALYVLTESNYDGETSRDMMGVNIKYDMICGSSCDELIQSLNAKHVEYNQQDATYEGGGKIFKLISDSNYLIFSAPQLYAGSATFEYIDNKQKLEQQLVAYNLAKSENTPEGYRKFIAENEDNTYLVEKAQADLEILEPAVSNDDNTGTIIGLGIVAAGIYAVGKVLSGLVSGGDSSSSSSSSSSANESAPVDPSKFRLEHDSGEWYKVYCENSFIGSIKKIDENRWEGTWVDGISGETWLEVAIDKGKDMYDCQSH
jgi:hypothetical protein